jgi:CIC family chloride channel protein
VSLHQARHFAISFGRRGGPVITSGSLGIRKARVDGYLFMVLAAVVLGIAGAAGAIVFRIMIRVFQGLFFGGVDGLTGVFEAGLFADPVDPLERARGLAAHWRILVPALGGLVVGPLVYFVAREAKGHGVPEVMEAVAFKGGVIRRRVVALKTLVSAISIGSGGSVGREGPIVQIGSAAGSWFGQLLKVPPGQLRTLVGCGSAAGIAATFNAPIAGALFAVEIVIGDFAVSQFSPIVISSVVATVISRLFLGNHPAFQVPEYDLVSPFELVPYMVVGVAAGLVALAFIRTLSTTEDVFDAIPIPEYLKAGLGGLCVGLIGVGLPQVFGVGYDTISQALIGQIPIALLGVLLVAKLLATSITIGSGGSGGIFAPSLFLGAATGGVLGAFIHQLFPESTATSGAYALVAMGALVAASTHAPITAIIMIFEMTQTIEIIPPLMAACVISTLVTTFLNRDSIYTQKLRRRGLDISRNEDPNILKSLYVRDIIDTKPEVISASASFATVMELMVQSDHSEFFVDNERREFIGAIYLGQVRRLLKEQEELRNIVVAGDMVEERVSVTADDNLDTVMRIFSRGVASEVAVVDAENSRRLIGSVHQRDVISAYNQEALRRDLVGGVSSRISIAGSERQVDLGGGYVLEERLAPRSFGGRTLSELDLRKRSGVQVLLIRSGEGAGGIRVPTPEDRIHLGDRLVIAGPRRAVERIERI